MEQWRPEKCEAYPAELINAINAMKTARNA